MKYFKKYMCNKYINENSTAITKLLNHKYFSNNIE